MALARPQSRLGKTFTNKARRVYSPAGEIANTLSKLQAAAQTIISDFKGGNKNLGPEAKPERLTNEKFSPQLISPSGRKRWTPIPNNWKQRRMKACKYLTYI
jgi:hypothetical protein